MKYKCNEMGRCPVCESYYLLFWNVEKDEHLLCKHWQCSHCGEKGIEYLSGSNEKGYVFIGHSVYNIETEELDNVNKWIPLKN